MSVAHASLGDTLALGVPLVPHQDQQPYLGIGQVPESLAGLQRLQELYNGRDATFRKEHAAQAAETAEGLLELGHQSTCWEVLSQDHSLTSLRCSLREKDESVEGQQEGDLSMASVLDTGVASAEKPCLGLGQPS